MSDLAAELTAVSRRYEQADNSHDIDRVVPLITQDAVCWFSDGFDQGLDEIAGAIKRIFASFEPGRSTVSPDPERSGAQT